MTFEKYLEEKFYEENYSVDCTSDNFNNWFSNLDYEEIFDYVENWHDKELVKLTDIIINKIN